MKKVFPLQAPGKVDQRVVESVKNEVRKYVKRERRKTLPEGFTRWDFLCQAGADQASAHSCTLDEISRAIDEVTHSGGKQVYVEIIATPAQRQPSTTAE